jgi:hypothetical protein
MMIAKRARCTLETGLFQPQPPPPIDTTKKTHQNTPPTNQSSLINPHGHQPNTYTYKQTNAAFYSMLNVRIPGIDVRSYMNNRAVLTMVANLHLVPGVRGRAFVCGGCCCVGGHHGLHGGSFLGSLLE